MKCRWQEEVGGKFTYFQDHRYNWASHITPLPNPTWEVILSKDCKGDKHHVFRQGNRVWGMDDIHIKTNTTIIVSTAPAVPQ
jgi:hypothetical protein